MLARCENPNHGDWFRYGERGIRVCDRWKVFSNFVADLGLPQFVGATIERRDNNGDYCPENCYWATRVAQARNRRSSGVISINGDSYSYEEFAELLGVPYNSLKTAVRRALATGVFSFRRKLTPNIDHLLRG
jgi:hypothetical protein